ncbi:MAG: DUF2199 domain-containing protein [Betaproteobacteria bacterium]|nr:DUF2199 domain-containing protein [Betaproteobacteria bacterium]
MSTSFVCATCGQEHSGLPQDYSFGLPDEVFELDFISRYLRARSNSDLCTLDESRYFMRGVIPLPFQDSGEEYCWGVWVEVSREDHDKYVRGYHDDLSAEPSFPGKLANSIPGYEETLNLPVTAKFGEPGRRPNYFIGAAAQHKLGADQQTGITAARHHEILKAVGHFKRHSAA